MNAGDWKCVIGILVVVVLLGTLFGFACRSAVIQSRQLNQCQGAGYTWRAEYADVIYCLRVDDEQLIGVLLQEVEAPQ